MSQISTPLSVSVEGLGKRYLLGQREPYKTLRASLTSLPSRVARRTAESKQRPAVWALRNVSFALKPGEVLGVIGHNGAGKSTLLKMLSRVTSPTVGRAVLYGRTSALLEVGTGFHPELTGRENVYLNGSVLGMRRDEIARKFAAIVEFSETGDFIDTPIKRYSSGMKVRLAFAVAAFLEPEILIVDEVLAVGDVAFQRRCLGKLGSSAREGRTVLFVSHNLPAVRLLCSRAIVLDEGEMVFDGEPNAAIDRYLTTRAGVTGNLNLRTAERPSLDMGGRVRFREAELIGASEAGTLGVGAPLTVSIELDVLAPIEDAVFVLNILTLEDTLVAQSVTANSYRPIERLPAGRYVVKARLESTLLQPGQYTLGFGARSNLGLEDQINSAGVVELVESKEIEFPWFSGPGGYLRLPVEWSALEPITDEGTSFASGPACNA